MQKTEDCDVKIGIGINQAHKFVSLREIKLDNLTFYDEGFSSSDGNSNQSEVFTLVEV